MSNPTENTTMKQFNHMYDIAFSVTTPEADPDKVDWPTLRAAIMDRVELMDREASEREGIGFCDSYLEVVE